MKHLPNMLRLKHRQDLPEMILALGVAFVWNILVYGITRAIAGSWYHYDMTTSIDELVPFLPWTISIYFGCYLVWGINYYLCANQDRAQRHRFFCGDVMARTVCFVLYMAVPTTNVRPEVAQDQNIWNMAMRFLYWLDSPDNLFPSIHCLTSWLCWVGVRNRKDIPAAYRNFSLVAAIAVCISTLTTRQHVIADVFAGVLLAELAYFLAGFEKFRGFYTRMITWGTGRLFGKFTARR